MGEAIGQVLTLGVGVALSPVPIIAVVLMLGTPRARGNGIAFVLGWIAGLALVTAIVLAVAGGAGAGGDDGPATWASWLKIVLGVLLLAVTASTALPTGLIKSIPVQAHVIVDYLMAGVLIASPFLFSFTGDGTATAFFIVLGVVHLLMTIATRFVSEERPRRTRQAA